MMTRDYIKSEDRILKSFRFVKFNRVGDLTVEFNFNTVSVLSLHTRVSSQYWRSTDIHSFALITVFTVHITFGQYITLTMENNKTP